MTALLRFVGTGAVMIPGYASTMAIGQIATWSAVTGTWDTTAMGWNQNLSMPVFGGVRCGSKPVTIAKALLRFSGKATSSTALIL